MYQSGHCTDGPAISVRYAEKDRALRPIRPVINAEPCYEGIGYIEGTRRVDQADIRNIAWVSILAGGNAGITYGLMVYGAGIAGEDFAHESLWMVPYEWREALRLNGAYEIMLSKNSLRICPGGNLVPRGSDC